MITIYVIQIAGPGLQTKIPKEVSVKCKPATKYNEKLFVHCDSFGVVDWAQTRIKVYTEGNFKNWKNVVQVKIEKPRYVCMLEQGNLFTVCDEYGNLKSLAPQHIHVYDRKTVEANGLTIVRKNMEGKPDWNKIWMDDDVKACWGARRFRNIIVRPLRGLKEREGNDLNESAYYVTCDENGMVDWSKHPAMYAIVLPPTLNIKVLSCDSIRYAVLCQETDPLYQLCDENGKVLSDKGKKYTMEVLKDNDVLIWEPVKTLFVTKIKYIPERYSKNVLADIQRMDYYTVCDENGMIDWRGKLPFILYKYLVEENNYSIVVPTLRYAVYAGEPGYLLCNENGETGKSSGMHYMSQQLKDNNIKIVKGQGDYLREKSAIYVIPTDALPIKKKKDAVWLPETTVYIGCDENGMVDWDNPPASYTIAEIENLGAKICVPDKKTRYAIKYGMDTYISHVYRLCYENGAPFGDSHKMYSRKEIEDNGVGILSRKFSAPAIRKYAKKISKTLYAELVGINENLLGDIYAECDKNGASNGNICSADVVIRENMIIWDELTSWEKTILAGK